MSEIAERELLLKLKVDANELRKLGVAMGKSQKQIKSSLEPVTQKIRDQQLAVEKAGLAAKKAQVPFAGYAMSIMFAGMALKRIFDTIWKLGTKAFQEVSHSVENSTTGFDIMEGSVKYLGYSLGQALEPVTEWLVPIIDNIADWVSRNESLVRGLITLFGVLGTAFAVGGAGKLAWDGFKGLKLAVGSLPALFSPTGLLVLGLTAIAGLAWKSFNETPEAWEAVKDSINNMNLTPISDTLKELLDRLLPGNIDSWGDFAWIVAWAAQFMIGWLQAVIGIVGVLANSIITLIDTILLLGEALMYLAWPTKSGRSAVKSRMYRIRDDVDRVIESAKTLGDVNVYLTPAEMKLQEGVTSGAATPWSANPQNTFNGTFNVYAPENFDDFVNQISYGVGAPMFSR